MDFGGLTFGYSDKMTDNFNDAGKLSILFIGNVSLVRHLTICAICAVRFG